MGHGIAAMNVIALWLAERSAFDATGAIPLAAVLVLAAALVVLTMTESALRWLALPLLGLGVGLLATRDLPDAFVSEDGALVALRLEDGRIAVNRPRPRGFIMHNWQRAFGGGEIVTPKAQGGFSCDDGLCLAARGDGAVLAHARDAQTARPACGIAGLIVIADATARSPCRKGEATVVTARDLARRGSVEIRFSQGAPQVTFAIEGPGRPWHDHRRFSRAARGLAPWRPAQSRSDDQTG
jgi:competence protein ComEC